MLLEKYMDVGHPYIAGWRNWQNTVGKMRIVQNENQAIITIA